MTIIFKYRSKSFSFIIWNFWYWGFSYLWFYPPQSCLLASSPLLLKWLEMRSRFSTSFLYLPKWSISLSPPVHSCKWTITVLLCPAFLHLLPQLPFLISSLSFFPASAVFVENPLGNENCFYGAPLWLKFLLFFLFCLSKFSLSLNVCLP